MARPNRRIIRVKSLTLNKFRAFSGAQTMTLDTDADLVIVTGPNGVGKTSLMDALCLAITGHRYLDREPLLSFRAREGSVSARVVLDDESEVDVCTTIRRGNRWSDISWDGHRILGLTSEIRPLHARASFYYQDILKYLFEEESQETRLEAFLTAGHVSPADVRKALSQAIQDLRKIRSGLRPDPGIRSEEELEGDRARLADRFQEGWKHYLPSVMLNLFNQVSLEPRTLVTASDKRLRKDWKKTVAAMIEDLSPGTKPMGDEILSEETPNVTLLAHLVGALRMVSERLQTSGSGIQHLQGLLQMNLNSLFTIDPTRFEVMKARLHSLVRERDSLSKRLSQVEQVLNRYAERSGFDPSLLDILKALRTSSEKWIDVQGIDPEYAPPHAVLDWIRVASEALTVCEPPVDVQMTGWYQRLAGLRIEYSDLLARCSTEIEQLEKDLQASQQMVQLMERQPTIAGLIRSAFDDLSETCLRGSVLLERLTLRALSVTTPSNDGLKPLLDTAQQWSQLENEAVHAQNVRQRNARYVAQMDAIDRLVRILEEEVDDERSSLSNLELIGPDSRRAFSRAMNMIMDLYHMRSGVAPVELNAAGRDRTWSITTEDGRSLSSLSSGQKSLLAISSMVALTAALRQHLWADVLAFDDFTSSLDLNHVPRLAALLRQVAYGATEHSGNDPNVFSKQVFLVSHHEDLTNRLLDFLIPPKGRAMRVLRFTQWSGESGPEVKQMEVETSADVSELDESIGAALLERLRRLYT